MLTTSHVVSWRPGSPTWRLDMNLSNASSPPDTSCPARVGAPPGRSGTGLTGAAAEVAGRLWTCHPRAAQFVGTPGIPPRTRDMKTPTPGRPTRVAGRVTA